MLHHPLLVNKRDYFPIIHPIQKKRPIQHIDSITIYLKARKSPLSMKMHEKCNMPPFFLIMWEHLQLSEYQQYEQQPFSARSILTRKYDKTKHINATTTTTITTNIIPYNNNYCNVHLLRHKTTKFGGNSLFYHFYLLFSLSLPLMLHWNYIIEESDIRGFDIYAFLNCVVNYMMLRQREIVNDSQTLPAIGIITIIK